MCLKKTIVLKYTLDCNLRCKYCYEFGREEHNNLNACQMKIEKIENIIERYARLFEKSKILWMLHGGEPLIYGVEYVTRIFEKIEEVNNKYNVDYRVAVQTNGTLINEEWVKLFDKYGYLLSERNISLSLDGNKSINNDVRIDMNGKGVFDKLIENVSLIRSAGLDITTISVVGRHNIHKVNEVYNSIKELEPNFAKFIPCYNFNKMGECENYGISPMEYADFICKLFDVWIKDLPYLKDPLVIDPITTIISKLTNSFVTWCEYSNNKCDNFLTIFPNGEMWLCDSFQQSSQKEYGFLGNYDDLLDDTLKKIVLNSNSVCKFEDFCKVASEKCESCDIRNICSGGCLPYRDLLRQKSEKLFNEYCIAKHRIIKYIEEGIEDAMA